MAIKKFGFGGLEISLFANEHGVALWPSPAFPDTTLSFL